MIYIIHTYITGRHETERFYNKGNAVSYYRTKVREMSFPDNMEVEILNDGEDNNIHIDDTPMRVH